MKKIIQVLAVVLMFLSCKTSKPDTPPETVSISDRYWKLIEIDGKPVGATNREPHMVLRQAENRVTGSGGCNSFFGTWDLPSGSRIVFTSIGSTKMACPNMEAETRFFQVLQQAEQYKMNGDTLSLHREKNSPLARFVADDNKKL